MSVVNKMLKDLEAREAQPNNINADYQPPQKSSFNVWKIATIGLVFIVITLVLLTSTLTDFFHTADSESLVPKPVGTSNITKKMTVQKTAVVEITKQEEAQIREAELQAEQTIAEIPAKPLESQLIKKTQTTAAIDQVSHSPKTPEATETPQPTEAVTAEKQSSFAMVSSSKESKTMDLKRQISEELASDNLNKASILLNQLISDEPNNLAARKKLASLHFSQGNYQQTKFLLLKSIEQFPEEADVKLMLARLYVAQDKPKDAFEILELFQPNQEASIEFLAYRAALAQQINKTSVAKIDYQTLTKLDPQNAKWWLGLGITNDKLGNVGYALHAYQNASAIGSLDLSVEEFVDSRISVLMEGQ